MISALATRRKTLKGRAKQGRAATIRSVLDYHEFATRQARPDGDSNAGCIRGGQHDSPHRCAAAAANIFLPDSAERTNLYAIAVCDLDIFRRPLGDRHFGKRIAISRTFDGDALSAQPDIYETSKEGERNTMNMPHEIHETPPASNEHESERHGKIGWAVLWLLGVPLPVLLVLYLLTGGGCNGG